MTLQSLVHTVDWGAFGCFLAGTATNGVDGKALILTQKPDIVLTDIKMPLMDGLSMIADAREAHPAMKVIVITGYDQFQYASRAIKLAVFDYILKPLDEDEIAESMRRVTAALEKEQSAMQSERQREQAICKAQLLSLLANDGPGALESKVLLAKCGLDQRGYCILLAHAVDGIPQALLNRMEGEDALIALMLDNELVLLAGCEAPYHPQARQLAKRLLDISPDLAVSCSGFHTAQEDVRTAYREARKAMLDTDVDISNGPVVFWEDRGGERPVTLAQLPATLERFTGDMTADQVLEKLLPLAGGRAGLLRSLLMLYATRHVSGQMPDKPWPAELEDRVYALGCVRSTQEAKASLEAFLSTAGQCAGKQNQTSLLARRALQYIALHATEGLRLEAMAERFVINPSYLSQLIRRETGLTYQQHVQNARMRVAKEMLADIRIRIDDIARAVRYENYVSFYNVFKKNTGMTPREYRNRLSV